MEIQNSTSDDAMIRVEGGPSGTIKDGTVVWRLGAGEKMTLSIEISCPDSRIVQVRSAAVKGLKLTKGDKGKYVIQVMNNEGRRQKAS